MIKLLLILLLSISASAKFGLETANGDPLELLELKTKAIVESPYAEVQYIQTYRNPFNYTIETEFNFPRTDSSIFHKFEAVFQNQTVVGRIFEKETAKKMYDWNIERGNTVAYSERKKVAPDVMNIKVGNIPAYETVEIVFSVIQPLETIINKFYELRLPAVLTERDPPASVDSNIQVELKSNSPFAILSNPTHMLKPELSEQPSGFRSKIYKAVWNATVTPNKDFVVHFGPEKLEKPETILASNPREPNNHVLLVNFIPDLTTVQPKVAHQLLETDDGLLKLKRMAYEYDIENAQAEFIFVIDRSGSMMGSRTENLRRALIKFLKAIPKTSYFNIISFGSTYQLYRPQSIPNSPQALEEAIEWVKIIQADMGGTEILGALQSLSQSEHTDFPRIVMILTDGDVFNPNEVIDYIAENAKKARFCSVGIGHGASNYLVRNMAKAGKCKSEFVMDQEDIGDKALYMVQAAVSQYVTDIRFDINCFNDNNQRVYSDKIELDLLLKDQAFNQWIYLEDVPNLKSCQATLAYYNSLQGKRVTEEVDIQAYEREEITSFWHKIAYDAKIKELEEGLKMGRTSYKGENAQSHIVKLSTKYQILSDYTSFLAVLQESTVNPDETAQKVYLPNMRSADYSAHQIESKQSSGRNEGSNNHRQAVNYLHSVNNGRRYSQSSDPIDIDIDLDVMVGAEISVDIDVELDYGGECEEINHIEIGLDVPFPADEEEGENEDEGRSRDGNDDIVNEDRKTSALDNIQAGWNCENANDTSPKECSGVEKVEKSKEEAQERQAESSNLKLLESPDLKLVNNTQINSSSPQLAENSTRSGQVPTPQLTQISDEKGSESPQQSEDKSSKILNLGFTGISLLVILLAVILF